MGQVVGRSSKPQLSHYAEIERKWPEHKIKVLIRAHSSYLVHISSASGDIDWETSEEFDADIDSLPEEKKDKYHSVFCEVALLERLPGSEFPNELRVDFQRLLGEAIVFAMEQNFVAAEKMIASAKDYFSARSQEVSRRWYLVACMAAGFTCLFFALAIWAVRDNFLNALGFNYFWISISSLFGGVGALFSVMLRTGKLHFKCASGKYLHTLEGFSRVLAGVISAGFVALALKSGLIFHISVSQEKEGFVLLLMALLAGCGERFAFSIMDNFGKESVQKEDSKKEVV